MPKRTKRSAPKAPSILLGHIPGARFHGLIAATLVVLVAAIYAKTATFGFTNWDDGKLIVDNHRIRSLSSESISQMLRRQKGRTYQPVRELSYAVDYALWKHKPGPYHVVNVLLHASAAVLLYFWLLQAIGGLYAGWHQTQTRLAAAVGSLLFAVHPVNVEAVAWASSRKYGLLAVFAMAAGLLHVAACTRTGGRRYTLAAASLGCSLLAMWSSPVGVVVPTLLVGTDLCIRGIAALKERWPIYTAYAVTNIAVTLSLIAVLTQGDGRTARSHAGGQAIFTVYTNFQVLVDYARNLVAPLWLNCRYHNYVAESLLVPKVLAGLLLTLVAVALASYLAAKRNNWAGAWAVCWFLVGWSPVASIIPIGTAMADRYLYLPAIAVFGLAGVLAAVSIKRLGMPAAAVSVVVLLAYAVGAYQRCNVWRDSESLWRDSLAKDPVSALPYNNLGLILDNRGDVAEGMALYQEAIKRNPDYKEAHYNLGRAYVRQHNPKSADPTLNDPNLLTQAMRHMQEALRIDDRFANAHNYQGVIHRRLGNQELAEASYRHALNLDPGHHEALTNLANLYLLAGDHPQAEPLYRKAIELAPAEAQPYANIGFIYHHQGELELAKRHYQHALQLQPNYPSVIKNLQSLQILLEAQQQTPP